MEKNHNDKSAVRTGMAVYDINRQSFPFTRSGKSHFAAMMLQKGDVITSQGEARDSRKRIIVGSGDDQWPLNDPIWQDRGEWNNM
jgi:hypothetical protein